ncbi:MAG: 4Fe-4S binding protein [Deltaproteobacteria bacterium]|nr:4Fe-4S binding protein [Deltaproteobacteria bacterium]MDQ3296147.1 4Fe-4S binding protein [Myxococcota bacterium]
MSGAPAPALAGPPPGATSPGDVVAQLHAHASLRGVDPRLLEQLVASGQLTVTELPRDTSLVRPADATLCLVLQGQVSIGVFDPRALAARGEPQRDATRGEQEGTLMPPPPLARTATTNLALFTAGEVFNLGALPAPVERVVAAFSLSRVVIAMITPSAIEHLSRTAPAFEGVLATALATTNARLRTVAGIKHEILDFYVRHGLSIAGPTVRVRQLDLCIDCKQCEEACEERHGAGRLVLGGFELGVLDFVFSCRTCADARCLTPCEHDAIKRDPATGEIRIVEDRCIGCSLCGLSCPYGAIDMINIAEPDQPSFKPRLKDRLDKAGKLGFGPGKGRKAPARRIANKCDHCAGFEEQACVSACPTGSLIEISPAALFAERPAPSSKRRVSLTVLPSTPFIDGINVRDAGEARVRTRRLSRLVWALGLGAILACTIEVVLRWFAPTLSASYRLLVAGGLEPGIAELNVSYLAGSTFALACGYTGTALMTISMVYAMRRRLRWFQKLANQFWLDVHLMTGVVGPMFIVLHSALRLTTWVSIPFWSMTAVVCSGVLGRYIYTLVPAVSSAHDLRILEYRRRIAELAKDHLEAATYAREVMDREAHHAGDAWNVGLASLIPWVISDDLRRRRERRTHRVALLRLAPRKLVRPIVKCMDRVLFYERRKELAVRGKALLKAWKRVHIPFSMVLLVTMLIHIAVELL